MVNYGAVYPQAILIFVVTLTYSVLFPPILIFGAVYFGMAYLVYKYKLLFGTLCSSPPPIVRRLLRGLVFYKPYESRGEAWPLTFTRLMWGVVFFQLFMVGLLSLSKSIVLSSLMIPLIAGTVYWTWYMDQKFVRPSQYVALDSICEVQRGEMDEVARLRDGEHVTISER